MPMRIGSPRRTPARKRSPARLGNVCVFRQEQRLEAALLRRASKFSNVDAIICGKIKETNSHRQLSFSALRSLEDHSSAKTFESNAMPLLAPGALIEAFGFSAARLPGMDLTGQVEWIEPQARAISSISTRPPCNLETSTAARAGGCEEK